MRAYSKRPTPSLCAYTLVCAALLCASCYSAGVDPAYTKLLQTDAQSAPSASALGAGDLLLVRVYNEKDLSGAFTVSPDGTISFPLVGKVVVRDMSCSQLEDLLQDKLADGYLKNPSVTCSVKEHASKKVFVFGKVKKPGTFKYEERMTIVQAVTLAGGFDDRAAQNKTVVVRNEGTQKIRARVPMESILDGDIENLMLLPGDIIFVPESIY